jgi:heavy metal sensor kinase
MKNIFRVAHYWHRRVPIRVRLTVWYLLSFGLILLIFFAFLEHQVMAGLEHQADTSLRLAANRTLDYVVEDGDRLAFQDIGALADMNDDFSVYLLAPDQQTVWGHLGIEGIPVLDAPAQSAFFTVKERGPKGLADDWRDDVRVYHQPIRADDGSLTGWLQIAQDFDRRHIMGALRGHLCLVTPLVLLLAGVGGIFLASRALRPIDQVTRTAQMINTTDLHQRLNYRGPDDEVGRLAMMFDGMLDRLQAGFERERCFTGDAAHELRTPLTALKGHIGVILSQPRPPGEYVETLHDLEQQVDRLIRLSTDLLFMARLEYGQPQNTAESIALSDLLSVLQDQIKPLAEAKTLSLTSHVEPDITVQGNMDLLIRLFLNLLDNAIKYTPTGGSITIHAQNSGDEIQVAIRDTGPGIPADQLPHLFQRFYRVERDRARREADQGGAGLGLAIAREIAHLHNGQITVESAIGQGSTFTVHLPK